jgi:quercetin dioxygenase-like cupin family protein
MRTRALGIAAAAALSVLMAPAAVSAQDAAAVNPKTIKVKVDNDRVRLFEATLAPGEKEQMHSHPASIVYVIAGGKMRSHAPDGTTTDHTYTTGEAVYREPLTHWAENVGTTTVRLIVVELKK